MDDTYPSFDRRHVYLRYDILPTTMDVEIGLRLAAGHQRLGVPAAFHLAWDAIEDHPRLRDAALRLRDFDPGCVHLGLHCDPISRWLARTQFGGDLGKLSRFVQSPQFLSYLDEILAAWRSAGREAAPLRALRDGAWAGLEELDRSFRRALGRSSSISGRRSPLAVGFSNARQTRPELAEIGAWFHAIDYLRDVELARLGYRFEATRFAGDLGPGPTVLFGGGEVTRLQGLLEARIAGGGGFVAIFPARHWGGEHYADLLRPAEGRRSAAVLRPAIDPVPTGPAAPLPERPILTNFTDLIQFGPRCERADTQQLAAAAREKIGSGVDRSFPRFIAWLRSEGYSFGGFEDGPPRFGERWAYLRHDTHIQDLLAAYVLADLHERLAVVGSFQIVWKFSRYEESVEPYFVKLLEFDNRFVQFGLHVAPTATWYLTEKLGGDYTKQNEAIESEEFVAWLLELRAAYSRDRDAAPELQRLRAGTDDTLSRIAASFRETFGNWRSISGHGNFLARGFAKAAEQHPELRVLRTYFEPVPYMAKYGVARFGFDYEATKFGADKVPFPQMMWETAPAETRRRWYHGRVEHGAGFVALLHPASWTCSHNATFFLPEGSTDEDAAPSTPADGRG
ncbi:MAG TPA: hypothetical protein VGS13_15325 [Stellaceae bacterium]|nr:hypothetical protein [Stellaceae bacterium]